MEVLGYCHGLVCVRARMFMDPVFLWNPCTREYKKLPLLRNIESSNDISYIKYGFGYDFKMEDYKVISFVGYKDERGCEVQMYTLGSNSWRIMDHIPYDLSCNNCVCRQVLVNGSHQLTFNGAIHWIARMDSVGAHASKVVISFNFEKEILKEIPLPMLFDEKFRPKLRVVGGNLCYLDLKPEVGFEVWKLMDYGGRTSWNKIFTYSKQQLVSPIENCTPLQVLKNGEILSLVRTDVISHLVLHDPERDTSRILEIKELEAHSVSSSVFVESLEPLNSQTYVGHAAKEDSESVVGLRNNKYLKEVMIIFAIFFLEWFLNDFLARVL
ncbi:hypothetical protein MKW92_019267 [Papaver armeniacum]|nr:hypothetical protein MKW92_019267 [Papaver armeniacum]